MPEAFVECIESINLEELRQEMESRFTDKLTKRIKMTSGIDGITSREFLNNSQKHLEAVKRQILTPSRRKSTDGASRALSRFTFSPFEKFEVLKKLGSTEKRPLCKATIKSILAQKMMMRFLEPQFAKLFLENSFAYQRGKNGKKAIKKIQGYLQQGYRYVLDADISKFFDNVDHNILLYQLRHYFPGEETLHGLLRRFLKTGYVDVEKHKKIKKFKKIRKTGIYEPRKLGLPQGGILSGALANVYLHALDCFIQDRFPEARYVRYADDFLLFAKTWEEANEACEAICSYLSEVLKLKLHPKKTKVRDLANRRRLESEPFVDFLGYRVTERHIKIQPKNMKAFQSKIGEVIVQWSKERKTLSNLVKRINTRMKGRLYDYTLCEGYNFIGNNWASYFSLITNTGQLKSLDAWISAQVLQAFKKRKGETLTRSHLKGFKLLTLVKLHYKMKKEANKKAKRYKALKESETQQLPIEWELPLQSLGA